MSSRVDYDPLVIKNLVKDYERIALVFQGGGALGAYQAGVYEALSKTGAEPNWISGISIGAINSALIAGNTPENRVPRLREFWETVSSRKLWAFTPDGDAFRTMRNQLSAMAGVQFGQPGFFRPRWPNPWLMPSGADGATSFYDTAPLRDTLLKLVDFDLINNGTKRFSVGATNVRTGNFIYFDNSTHRIGPEHIMASGALPPGFPAIRIDGEYYWDGGVVSNTPLQWLLDRELHPSTLVFQVDLFSARGSLPRNMFDVIERQKDIGYSSRTRSTTDLFRRVQALRTLHAEAIMRIPEQLRTEEDLQTLDRFSKSGAVNICHLIYQGRQYERDCKDYEFSAASMREHWQSGVEDTLNTLRHTDWLVRPPREASVVVHDIHRKGD